ncbi:MAG: hypothetical protein H8D87_04790 [Deltaproteobacteria bacterium]|nr:hypothetical protein [Candidatus Desulfobacula maris]
MEDTAEKEEIRQEAKDREDIKAEVFDGKAITYGQAEKEDPLANVNSDLLEKINTISSKLSDFERFGERLKQTESRIGSISNKLSEEKKAKESQPTEEELAKKEEDEEAWNDVEIEFPDIAKGIKGKLSKSESVIESLRKDITDLKTNKTTSIEDEIKFVSVVHPDWQEVVASDDYQNWLAMQPAEVQTVAKTSQKAVDAVKVLNTFKRDFSKEVVPETLEEIRKKRLQASIKPKTTNRKHFNQKSEADMTEAELRDSVRREVFG